MFVKDKETGLLPQISQREAEKRYQDYLNNLPTNYNDLEISSRQMLSDVKSKVRSLEDSNYQDLLESLDILDYKNTLILNFAEKFILHTMKEKNTFENYNSFIDIRSSIKLENPNIIKFEKTIEDNETNILLNTTGLCVLRSLKNTIDANQDMLLIKTKTNDNYIDIRRMIELKNDPLSIDYKIFFIKDTDKEELTKVLFPDKITYAFQTYDNNIELLTFKVPDISDDRYHTNREWELLKQNHITLQEYERMYKKTASTPKDTINKIVVPNGNTGAFVPEINRFIFDKIDYKIKKSYKSKEIKSRENLEEARDKESISRYKIVL
jgi:hypothetical protein